MEIIYEAHIIDKLIKKKCKFFIHNHKKKSKARIQAGIKKKSRAGRDGEKKKQKLNEVK